MGVTGAVAALLGAGLVLAAIRLRRRATLVPDEPGVWPWMLLTVLIIGTSASAGALIDALVADRAGWTGSAGLGDLVFGTGCVLACVPLWLGLINWNRARAKIADPGESINGLGAVVAVVALGNLVVPHFRHPATGVQQWQLQTSIWAVAALTVMLGAALTIALIAGLLRDPRIWLMVVAIGAPLAAVTTGLVIGAGAGPAVRAVSLLAAALIPVCVLIEPRPGSLPAAHDQGTVYGALTVMLVGVAVLILDDDLAVGGSRVPTIYGIVAVILAGFRVLRLVQDLSNLSQSRREALTDELTGIANRRALLAALDQALLTAASTSLLIVDLDRFKAINDRFGHAAGDRVLQHVAGTFRALVPDGGLLARLGGDEFAVLLTDVDPGVPADLARRLAEAAAPLSDVKGQVLQVGASVGVATLTRSGLDGGSSDDSTFGGGELLRQADAAMYQAKLSGSGVGMYDGVVDAVAQKRLVLVEDLHRALAGPPGDREQIVVHFQPQLATATGWVAGAEALVRWQHPRLGLLPPDAFIDLAEDNELMWHLTTRVMHEAATQAARWRAAGHRLRVSVNVSATCLSHRALMPLIDEILATGMAAGDLVLEVTETSLMREPALALAAMRGIAGRGVGISIDDYGTGYSSLSYMNDLPATELKIDRSFTMRIISDPRTEAIVAGTVELAHRLGMRLIAEGVEDEETLAVMARLGCDETQGYLHSRPLQQDAFLDWLLARPAGADPVEPASPAALAHG